MTDMTGTTYGEPDFPAAWWPRPSIRMSRDFGELADALAAAQSEMKHPTKSKVNPQFRSKYADLAEVIDAIKVLNKHGIAVMFSAPTSPDVDSAVRIIIVFAHRSNQWMEGVLDVPMAAVTAQGLGSSLTYGRRYLLSGMCNVAAEEDDDGNEASKPAPLGQATPRVEKPSPLVEHRPIMQAIVAAMRAEAKELKLSDTDLADCVKTASGGRTEDLKLLWRDEVDKLREAMAKKATQPTLENV
jgi:ERF superfamily